MVQELNRPETPRRRVHFVYAFGSGVSCPDAIGREIGTRLRARYEVLEYGWAGFRKIRPAPGDVLLGHACPIPFSTFRRSCRDRGWSRVLLFSPHCQGDDYQPSFNRHVLPYCNLYLAITGNYWFSRIGRSGFGYWLPKMRHIDLAVNQLDFPPLKTSFNPPGHRKFVYIGRDAWYKNVEYLSRVALAVPDTEVAWIGSGADLPGLRKRGRLDFSTKEGRQAVSEYDFLLTAGKADGNPATVLEAMAWGLIPVCTPQSGYENYSSILNIPLDDPEGAAEIIRRLQSLPEERLRAFQRDNRQLLDDHFNWDRAARQVIGAIEDTSNPPLGNVSLGRRVQMLWAEVTSPYWADYFDLRRMPQRVRKYLRPRQSITIGPG